MPKTERIELTESQVAHLDGIKIQMDQLVAEQNGILRAVIGSKFPPKSEVWTWPVKREDNEIVLTGPELQVEK